MKMISKACGFLMLLTPLVLTGCILLTAEQLQSFKLLIETGEPLPAGRFTEVYSSIYPMKLKLKNNWVKVQGQLGVANPSRLPNKIQLEIVSVDSTTERIYDRFKLNLSVKNDGTFTGIKKFKKNIRPETLQSFMVKPIGGAIAAKTDVALCVEVVKKKGEASPNGSCTISGGGSASGEVVTIRIVDNAFDPKSAQIQPGDTVEWVFSGSDLRHTATAMDGAWDSGFAFQANGATFQRRFTAADDGKSFEYFCVSHQACCQMQGSILVGDSAPAPRPGY